MVFPSEANYTRALIHKDAQSDTLLISHKAAGADKWRYSLNWGTSWSDWSDYKGGNNTLQPQPWSGTKRQRWSDEHIIAQYWGRFTGSSAVIQHADLGREKDPARRFPHLFAHGRFNQYGFDAGLKNDIKLHSDGEWKFNFMSEWPDNFQVNVWGINPDGQPDATGVLGDINEDFILDRLPPSSLSHVAINVSSPPPSPFLSYQFVLDDGTYRYQLIPVGSRWVQLALFILFLLVPISTGALAVWMYVGAFYDVKFNEIGASKKAWLGSMVFSRIRGDEKDADAEHGQSLAMEMAPNSALTLATPGKRRCVLIATMEYDIEDWNIKIKIGGLGVMAQLMGKNLGHQGKNLHPLSCFRFPG
jgi:alpha-1,3-glucan synthase